MTHINSVAQSLNPDGIVSLFALDTTSVGGTILYFVQGSEHNGPLSFGGVEYQPVDVVFEGLETSGVGALPEPIIRVSNVDGIFQAIVNTFGDLTGCTVYRMRTFVRFLDGQPEADGDTFYGPDQYRLERKTSENSSHIEWSLSSSFDQEGKLLPGRVVIRDTCLWRYRHWDQGARAFDYSRAQCPYAGNRYFDINDQPVTDPTKDVPSRRLSCCRTRFGRNQPLPFGGFPGVARGQA